MSQIFLFCYRSVMLFKIYTVKVWLCGFYRAMLMTACDLSAITKPWPVQQRVGIYQKPDQIPYFPECTVPAIPPIWTHSAIGTDINCFLADYCTNRFCNETWHIKVSKSVKILRKTALKIVHNLSLSPFIYNLPLLRAYLVGLPPNFKPENPSVSLDFRESG